MHIPSMGSQGHFFRALRNVKNIQFHSYRWVASVILGVILTLHCSGSGLHPNQEETPKHPLPSSLLEASHHILVKNVENNDASKTNNGLQAAFAITEDKRPQTPGGCVGMFYQLLDWNRRLAKKKLFSKKLLPPARAERVAKKFGGDDKLPTAKLLLIAEENRGGFPNAKKSGIDIADNAANGERYREIRSPSLVARLMGLESMPAVRRENPKDSLNSEYGHGRTGETDGKFRCSNQVGCDKDEFYLVKGDGKVETRPQKLQKTGVSERRPVTRFGAEVLQVPAGQSGSGSPWSLFEDQALVVLVHDMGPNWELVSDAISSTLQFKCIFRNPKECKERHKVLMDRNAGDGADSAEDSGSSQPYPSTLPGIPKDCDASSLGHGNGISTLNNSLY